MNATEATANKRPVVVRHPWLSAVLISVTYICLLYALFGQPGFETNDDVIMAMKASGTGTVDQPNPHLIYSNFLASHLLTFLYKAMPDFAWYGLYLVSGQILALSVVLRLLISKFTGKGVYFAIALAAIALTRPLLLIQYTTVATLLGTAAALLLLSAMTHFNKKGMANKYIISSIALFGLATIYRPPSAILIFLLTFAVVAIIQIRKLRPRQLFSAILPLSIAALLSMCLYQTHRLYYQADQKWSNIYNHNEAIWKLSNTNALRSSSEVTERALHSVNWGAEEMEMLYLWFFSSPEFSDDNLRTIYQHLSSQGPIHDIDAITKQFLSIFTDETAAPILAIIAIGTLLLARGRFSLTQSMLLNLFTATVAIALIVKIKCPARVYTSMLSFTAVLLLLYSSPKRIESLLKRRVILIPTMVILCLAIAQANNTYKSIQERTTKLRIALEELTSELAKEKDVLYVTCSELPIEQIGVFENPSKYFGGLKLIMFNSGLDCPLFYKRLKEFEITDLLKGLDGKNVRLIAGDATKNAYRDFIIKRDKKQPLFTQIATNQSLGVSSYKVRFSDNLQRPDTDPLCPKIEPEDQLIFPTTERIQLMDCEPLKSKTSAHHYDVSGMQAVISLDLSDKSYKAKDYSHLIVEFSLPSQIKSRRRLAIWLATEEVPGTTAQTTVLPDSGWHRYAFDLNQFKLNEEDRLLHLNINPLLQRTEKRDEQFAIGRIALKRRISESTK